MIGSLKTIRSSWDHIRLGLKGYPITPHMAVSFRDIGVGIAKLSAPLGLVPKSGRPSLLMYKPASGANATDMFGWDYPYTLVGWAYTSTYVPLRRPAVPGLCVDQSDWFIHEQGVHPFGNWGFFATPPTEPWRGASRGSSVQRTGPLGIYHGRIWDLHVFADFETGVPSLSTVKPGLGIQGIDPQDGTAWFYPDR